MKNDVLHIIKTKSLESDGRLLKWVRTLNENNIFSTIYLLEDIGSETKKSPVKATVVYIKLFFRKLFKQRKGYFFKVPEYSIKSYLFFRKSKEDTVIFHDMQHYFTFLLLLAFGKKGKMLIWDMHELPQEVLLKFSITRFFLKKVLENMDLLVYTNDERRNYLTNAIEFKEKAYLVLNNYPNREFITSTVTELPDTLNNWLSNKPYILWMGAAVKGRNFDVMYKAYSLLKDAYKLVIVGSLDNEIKKKIQTDIDGDHIFQTFVPQNELMSYIDNAYCSVVLYNSDSPNNRYCEPNRLYQLIVRKIPVVAGNNPPMKSVIEQSGSGVLLSDDGRDVNVLRQGLLQIEENRSLYLTKLNDLKMETTFCWESQFLSVLNFMKSSR